MPVILNAFVDSYYSPLGPLYVVFSGRALAAIEFVRPALKSGRMPEAFRAELDAYFAGTLREFRQEIKFLTGTAFDHAVWNALGSIPYGETRSYKWLAEAVGSPKGARAVGQALGRNPIPIVLPCHRVIESGGRIGGYTPGIGIKDRLLMLEYLNLT